MTDFTSGQKDFLEGLFLKLNATIELKATEVKTEIKEKIDEFEKDITERFAVLEKRIYSIEAENKTLNKRILSLERRTRKNNIAIFGIEKTEASLAETVCNIFKNNLELQINEEHLNDVYCLTNSSRDKCTVIVEFISYQKKLLVLKNPKKLKGSNIYIAKDQCREDISKNKILLKHMKETRQKGVPAYIKANKLYISNIPYTAEQLETENQEENQEQAQAQEDRNKTEKLQIRKPQTTTKGINQINRTIEDQDIEIRSNQEKQKSEVIAVDRKINTRARIGSCNTRIK